VSPIDEGERHEEDERPENEIAHGSQAHEDERKQPDEAGGG